MFPGRGPALHVSIWTETFQKIHGRSDIIVISETKDILQLLRGRIFFIPFPFTNIFLAFIIRLGSQYHSDTCYGALGSNENLLMNGRECIVQITGFSVRHPWRNILQMSGSTWWSFQVKPTNQCQKTTAYLEKKPQTQISICIKKMRPPVSNPPILKNLCTLFLETF